METSRINVQNFIDNHQAQLSFDLNTQLVFFDRYISIQINVNSLAYLSHLNMFDICGIKKKTHFSAFFSFDLHVIPKWISNEHSQAKTEEKDSSVDRTSTTGIFISRDINDVYIYVDLDTEEEEEERKNLLWSKEYIGMKRVKGKKNNANTSQIFFGYLQKLNQIERGRRNIRHPNHRYIFVYDQQLNEKKEDLA